MALLVETEYTICKTHIAKQIVAITENWRLPRWMLQRYRPIVANFTKIVSATDFSEDSTLAVGYAEEIARRFGAEIILLHVDQALPPVMVSPEIGPVMDVGAMTRIAEEQRMLAQKELDKIVNRMRDGGLKARSLLKVGSPFLEVIHAAQTESADLIVMGTHGRTGIAHVLMGSVAERVVQKAHCPVLTIRHPDRKFKHPARQVGRLSRRGTKSPRANWERSLDDHA